MTPTMVLSATNFCATVCAAAGPCSTGASPGTSLIFRPIVCGSVLTASFAQRELLLAEEAGTTRERREHPDLERARAARCRGARGLVAPAGAAVTVAASAVAAATAANSGNDLAFFMYELLLGGSGHTEPRAIGRRKAAMLLAMRSGVRSASASTQLRVSVNWWKRTALPSRELPDVRERDVERLAGGLRAGGVAADRDHVVVTGEELRRGRRRSPPTSARRSGRRRRPARRQAVVDAAVGEALGLVPDDRVVHHGERAVEVAAREGLVGAADGGEVFGVRGQGGGFYAVSALCDQLSTLRAGRPLGRRVARAASLLVPAELLAQGRQQLVGVVGLAARAEALVERLASTCAGTASSIAASAVQRPSPESETWPEKLARRGLHAAPRPSGRAARS